MAPVEAEHLPGPPKGWRLDVSPWVARKRQAVMAHRSQTTRLIADDPSGFILSEAVLSVLIRPFEVYLEEQA